MYSGGGGGPILLQLMLWCRVFLEKLVVIQLIKKFPALLMIERIITTFTKPATGPYPEPAMSSAVPETILP